MTDQRVIQRIRGSAAVALECLKSAHTQGDAKRYIQQVLDGIDVAVSLGDFSEDASVTSPQIKHMVDRFLGWRLPNPWHPDNGISYQRPDYAHAPADHDWPVGTNLFDADQAEAMVRYMIIGMPLPRKDS